MVDSIGLFGLVVSILAVSILFRLSVVNGKVDYFSPPFVFFFLVFAGCVIRAIIFISNPPQYLLYGSIALLIAVLFYSIGYIIPAHKYVSPFMLQKTLFFVKSKFIYYITIAFALVLTVFFFRETGFSIGARFLLTEDGVRTSHAALQWGADILYVAFLLRLSIKRNFKSVGLLYIVFFIISLYASALLGARLSMLLYILAALLVRFYCGDRKIYFTPFIIIAIFIIGVIGAARTSHQGGESYGVLNTFVEHSMQRPYMLSLDKLSFIVGSMSDNGQYWYGKSFASILLIPIPRNIFENKPDLGARKYVGQEIYQLNNLAGVPPGFIGELFINFSWFGIVIGMFAMGYVCRILWNTFKKYKTDPLLTVWYSIFYIFLITILGVDALGAVVLYFKLYIPALLLGRYYNP